LSAGLEYDPGFYSDTEELIALARQAAAFDGFYMPHIRDEEDGIFQALEETLEIARKASVGVHISHLKLGNRNVAGRTREVLALVDGARQENLDLTADCYPYTAWASDLGILVPSRRFQDLPEVEAGLNRVGGADKVLITRYATDVSFEFKTLSEIAAERQQTPARLFMEMMRSGGAGIIGHSMDEADVHAFYRHPEVMVASDGGLDSRHPRKAGTFPRVLAHMVREAGVLSLESAIHKMSEKPAKRLGLVNRGLIRPGYRADLVLFDPHQIRDRSTFQEPHLLADGIDMTLVNGVVVWERGQTTGKLPGEVIEN
jgi:N-acyl-D-amino-acid deacylase